MTLLSNNPNEQPRIIGKTEVIKNTLSPRWTTKFDIDYEFGSNVRINIGVWDEVRKAKNHKPMGSAVFEVGAILGSKGNTKAKKLRQGGTLFCRITPAPANSGSVQFVLAGDKLKNTDGMFGKSDPFFEVSAKISTAGGMTWQAVYRSKPVMNNLSPVWEPATIELARLGGDVNAPILIEAWDWTKNGKHTPMGRFECTVGALVSAAGRPTGFTLIRNKKPFGTILVQSASVQGVSGDQNGQVVSGVAPKPVTLPSFSNISVQEQAPIPPPMLPPPIAPTTTSRPKPANFVEYLAGGLELELSIAIDFTGSNGDPRTPGTLHYIHPDEQLNDYEKAITAVGGVIARYDSDQKFPCYGFGAKYGGVVQHFFQVGNSPELNGINGVLQAYRQVFLSGLTMSGPTVFAEIIDYTAATSRSKHEALQRIGKQAYKVLLILTDGAVSDIERTKESIRNAADAPMSIVIVGIGGADFQAMRDLDDFLSQDKSLRDIVQFVEFSQHAHNRQSLTSATLEEIPDQLVQFFQSRGIGPLPPVSGSQTSLVPEDYDDEDIDLSLDMNDEGEIALLNTNGAMYDDTKYNTFADYSGITPLAAPVVVPARIFQVQVPDGVAPGGQLQVTNPVTGQNMIVTVPPGYTPGSRFNVQY